MKKKLKKLKPIPEFKNEDEEREFWGSADSSKYIDWENATINPIFPNLKFSTESISLRMPSSILAKIKVMANERDIPYQSFIKMILADRVGDEMKKYNIKNKTRS